jgi:hypothetical protein
MTIDGKLEAKEHVLGINGTEERFGLRHVGKRRNKESKQKKV